MATKDDSFEAIWNQFKDKHPEDVHILDSETVRLYLELAWTRGMRYGVKDTVDLGVKNGIFPKDFLERVKAA